MRQYGESNKVDCPDSFQTITANILLFASNAPPKFIEWIGHHNNVISCNDIGIMAKYYCCRFTSTIHFISSHIAGGSDNDIVHGNSGKELLRDIDESAISIDDLITIYIWSFSSNIYE